MGITEKKVWETSDETVHTDYEEALQHESVLELIKNVTNNVPFEQINFETAEYIIKTYILTSREKVPLENVQAVEELIDAIKEASDWRGNLMPEEYAEFDQKIDGYQSALQTLSKLAGVEYVKPTDPAA